MLRRVKAETGGSRNRANYEPMLGLVAVWTLVGVLGLTQHQMVAPTKGYVASWERSLWVAENEERFAGLG